MTPVTKKLLNWIANHPGPVWHGFRTFSHRVAPGLVLAVAPFLSLLAVQAQELPNVVQKQPDPRSGFESRDVDEDNRLTEAEFLAPVSEDQQGSSKRDFTVFDLNRDGALVYDEYLNIPSLMPRDRRGRLPDPVVTLMENRIREIEASWKTWDTNGDGAIDRDEFTRSEMSQAVPGLALSSWQDWSEQGGPQVTLAGCRSVLEVAYGVRRTDGQVLRRPSGLVVNWTSFLRMDSDQDDALTAEEYIDSQQNKPMPEPLEKIKADFDAGDADDDKRITFAEWSAILEHWHDHIAEFLELDTNLNGQLERGEHTAPARWAKASIGSHVLTAFDQNKDGSLSLEEYRLTPFANEFARWDRNLTDADDDGRLSPGEFRAITATPMAGLTAVYFEMLDLNADGQLDADEFVFNIKRKYAPRSEVFRQWDTNRDQLLSMEEVLSRNRKGVDESAVAYEKKIARVEDSFHKANLDGDRGLNQQEFQSDVVKNLLSPKSRPTAKVARANPGGGLVEDETNWRLWILAGANVLIVGAAVVFLTRKS